MQVKVLNTMQSNNQGRYYFSYVIVQESGSKGSDDSVICSDRAESFTTKSVVFSYF